MAEDKEEEFVIEKAVRIGVIGGTKAIRPTSDMETPLTPKETAMYEGLLGKLGAHGAPGRPASDGGLCALVAEDDPEMRRLIGTILGTLKCKPLEVADGANAMKALVKYKVDLMILDLRLPKYDGFQVLRGIRNHLKITDLPIFVITGLPDIDDEIAALNLGATGFLKKPFNLKQFTAHIRSVLRGASPTSTG